MPEVLNRASSIFVLSGFPLTDCGNDIEEPFVTQNSLMVIISLFQLFYERTKDFEAHMPAKRVMGG